MLIALSYGGGCLQGKCLNLQEQIDLFQRTVLSDLPKHFKSSYDLSEYLSKSIFISSIGSNDYINNYLQPNLYNTSKDYPPQPFAQLLVDALSQSFEVMSLFLNLSDHHFYYPYQNNLISIINLIYYSCSFN